MEKKRFNLFVFLIIGFFTMLALSVDVDAGFFNDLKKAVEGIENSAQKRGTPEPAEASTNHKSLEITPLYTAEDLGLQFGMDERTAVDMLTKLYGRKQDKRSLEPAGARQFRKRRNGEDHNYYKWRFNYDENIGEYTEGIAAGFNFTTDKLRSIRHWITIQAKPLDSPVLNKANYKKAYKSFWLLVDDALEKGFTIEYAKQRSVKGSPEYDISQERKGYYPPNMMVLLKKDNLEKEISFTEWYNFFGITDEVLDTTRTKMES
jgi:hypothetical protein